VSTIAHLLLLLVCAHALGRVCARIRQPPLLGHMVAGIVLGPSFLGWIASSSTLGVANDVAVFFVVISSGLQMDLNNVVDAFRGRGAIAMSIGFLLPLAAGAVVAALFGAPPVAIAIIALCMAVTALPVALQIMKGFGLLRTRIADMAISGALLADILVFVALGAVIELAAKGSSRAVDASLGTGVAKLAGLLIAIAAARWICLRISARSEARHTANMLGAVVAVLCVAALGILSHALGFHFAIGVFLGAMMIKADTVGATYFARADKVSEASTDFFFGPLFIAYQGVQFELQSLSDPAFVFALVAIAIAAKLLSGYLVGRLQRMSRHDAMGVGIVMNARGVMELVVANIAFRAGLIDDGTFSALVLMGLATTVATPIMLRRWQAPVGPAHREQ
jgi:Kef-type K+ transport system membrane component KefB